MNAAHNPTKEIAYNGQIERYEIVDGYLEMFVGYVSTCREERAPVEHPALKAERDARLSPKQQFLEGERRYMTDLIRRSRKRH